MIAEGKNNLVCKAQELRNASNEDLMCINGELMKMNREEG